MHIYPPSEGLTAEELRKGHWALYADVHCDRCDRDYSVAQVGSVDGNCPKCGERCH